MTDKGKKLNAAISQKVENVLNNTAHPTSIYISIHSTVGEVPSIRYTIEENIIPDYLNEGDTPNEILDI